jgi:hypothetical protein
VTTTVPPMFTRVRSTQAFGSNASVVPAFITRSAPANGVDPADGEQKATALTAPDRG